jgi:hypothetical protein
VGAAVYLVLHRGDPFGSNNITVNEGDNSVVNNGNTYALWWFSDAQVLANYDGLGYTTSPWDATPPKGSAPSAAHVPPAAVDSFAQSLPPGPAAGSPLAMFDLAQAAALSTPQAAPVHVAAAIPVNRLKTLDAVFAAGDFADEERGAGSDSGNRSSDDIDAWFVPDELASWGVKLTNLRTGPRSAST